MQSSRPTVLVVDDDEGCRRLHQLWLGDEYTVRTAASGEQALSALDETVSVVVLDREMPGLSGEDVLDRVEGGDHDPAVVFVSSLSPSTAPGGNEALQKPITGEKLREVIDRLTTREAGVETIVSAR